MIILRIQGVFVLEKRNLPKLYIPIDYKKLPKVPVNCRTLKFSTSSPFAGVTFLKNPANSKTALREVQTLREKRGMGNQTRTKHDINMYN
jgi:hypothetical protein